MTSKRTKLAPLHPGEVLREDFLNPLGLSINALARALHVPPNHVSGIVNEKRGISALMALRLARYFGTSPELWLALHRTTNWMWRGIRPPRRLKSRCSRGPVRGAIS